LQTYHFARRIGFCGNGGVDSLRLPAEVRVECAKYDPSVVRGSVLMEAEKVAAIVRQKNPAFGGRECQNLDIRNGRVSLSGLHRGQHVMPQSTQFRYHVLVGIKAGH
jgi:hypothetical protein